MYLLFQDGLRCGGCKGNAETLGRGTCGYSPGQTTLLLSRKIFLVVYGIMIMEDRRDTRNGLQGKRKPGIRKWKTLQVRQ